MSDHSLFSSYEGHKERRKGKIRGAFSRMHRALDSWMLARAPASPARDFHHHGPRYFNFDPFNDWGGAGAVTILYSFWEETVRK